MMRRHLSASLLMGSARLAIQIRCPETSPSGELNTSAKSETMKFKEVQSFAACRNQHFESYLRKCPQAPETNRRKKCEDKRKLSG